MREELQRLCEKYGCAFETDVPLSKHTTFRIGGAADYWVEISNKLCLQALVQFCKANAVPYFVLGKGSNILASDEGYRGVILHLGNAFSDIEVTGCSMTCQAGAGLGAAARAAAAHSLSGMEALSGIPGTIGGALYMNAGAYGSEMKDVVVCCEYLTADGEICVMPLQDMCLSYRHSAFMENGGIILSVTLQLQQVPETQSADILQKMDDFNLQRKTKQPLEYPSAGSTFKRPEGSYASLLVDQCGLKGKSVGGAQVSEKHAGFVINTGGATCADVFALCDEVRDIVQEKTGYVLELEPVILQ